ncbi:glycoside hydrolase family protein [Rhodovastum atsumiense]|uniref:Glycoside hydrolase family 5 domain-containing protein n=1 Tax=Rhodovastum atsumiense TaxID=504468 RepID=A0A5M6ISS4_9PROT|nr:hypothetical protein [Rhodovastum atsumiense]KAA5610949.1 hypothetical protein F1189_17085 [Rhodovastum atsumiense]
MSLRPLGRRGFTAGAIAATALGSVAASARAAPVTAARAADFIRSIGVQVHLNYNALWGAPQSPYARPETVEAALSWLNPQGLGVTLLRDTLFYAVGARYFDQVRQLGKLGYRWDIYIGYDADNPVHGPQFDLIERLLRDGAMAFVEGCLEVDNAGWGLQARSIAYQGADGGRHAGWRAVIAAQRDLHERFHGRIPVALWSLADPANGRANGPAATTAGAMGTSVAALADYGNVHFYQHHGRSPGDPDGGELAGIIRAETDYAPDLPFVITETGFVDIFDDRTGYYGTREVNAAYTLRLLLGAFQAGSIATVIYQLFDEAMDHADDMAFENHWGLFTARGEPKPAATALRHLAMVLGDAGPDATGFAPSDLAYRLHGLPPGGRSLLLQKSDGRFALVVWSEDSLLRGRQSLPPPLCRLELELEMAFPAVRIFDPLASPLPRRQDRDRDRIDLTLGAAPLVIELSPPLRSRRP